MKSIAIITISLTLLASLLGVKGQGCGVVDHDGVSPIVINADETTGADIVLQRFQLFSVNASATVSNPFNKYLQALRYANGVYDIATARDGSFANFVAVERVTQIARTSVLYCADGSEVRILFLVNIPDLNNNAPEFDQASYTITVQLPLAGSGNHTNIEGNVIVSDRDLEFENADVYITSSNRHVIPSVTRLWEDDVPLSYDYKVDFLVENSIEAGEYVTLITADDGSHFTSATVTVNVLPAGTPEPEPTQSPPTTQRPTGETAETETEDTTVEATTPEPETTAVPTTEGPAHKCGIVGLDPTETITLAQPLSPTLPTGTEIWRATMFNVNSTQVVSHAHNKYLAAYRQATSYFIQTTAEFPKFLTEQSPATAITRTVNFICADGSLTRYLFSLAVDDGPIAEPTLKSILY